MRIRLQTYVRVIVVVVVIVGGGGGGGGWRADAERRVSTTVVGVGRLSTGRGRVLSIPTDDAGGGHATMYAYTTCIYAYKTQCEPFIK